LRDHDFHTSYQTLSSLFVPTPVFLEKNRILKIMVNSTTTGFFMSQQELKQAQNSLNKNSDNLFYFLSASKIWILNHRKISIA